MMWTVPWMIFTLAFKGSENTRRTLHLITITTGILFLVLWNFIPQYLPLETIFIWIITIVKSMRHLGLYDIMKKGGKLFMVCLLMCAPIASDAQEKIAGISLVAPPSKFISNPIIPLKEVHANWVALIPYGFSRKGQPQVYFNSNRQWWGEREEGIEESIRLAKDQGLKIMLKPQVWIRGGWVGAEYFEKEEDWKIWESTYREYILTFARMAQKYHVDMFCVGTEYGIAVVKRELFWRDLIDEIREFYSGELIYSANWDDYETVPFWDDLDYVGISSYFPLAGSKTPSVFYLKLKWRRVKSELRRYSKKMGKKIVFTEFGYLSVDGSAGKTWELENQIRELPVNEMAQANAYEALFSSFSEERFWHGGFLWKWFPDGHGHEGYIEKDYTPQGKVSLGTLAEWYRQIAN